MKKLNFVRATSHSSTSKERSRRLHNAKHCECQAYEAEKIKRNQDLVTALQSIFKTHGEKP